MSISPKQTHKNQTSYNQYRKTPNRRPNNKLLLSSSANEIKVAGATNPITENERETCRVIVAANRTLNKASHHLDL